ncbi:hypothetical protein RGQ29_011517 [Quercus rubra]|uniref:Ubiquitin-like protease family profile domain-containing protein n=1 Tax=Quercus rubra TaxID=3512 RepID=A0AAN7FXC6_QUERU|nr:hypothetical protein RGQ29_011517 [Quercus rubra]
MNFSEDKKTSFTYLDCLWFELHRKSAYKTKVLTWIQKDIFSKKYVLVPIVCCLLIFCHFGLRVKTLYQIPLLVPKVPQQRNGEECHSFILYFINLFVESAPEDFSTQHFPYFMKDNWFTLKA